MPVLKLCMVCCFPLVPSDFSVDSCLLLNDDAPLLHFHYKNSTLLRASPILYTISLFSALPFCDLCPFGSHQRTGSRVPYQSLFMLMTSSCRMPSRRVQDLPLLLPLSGGERLSLLTSRNSLLLRSLLNMFTRSRKRDLSG